MTSEEAAAKLEVRLTAIEYLLNRTYLAMTLLSVPLDQIDKHFDKFINDAAMQPFPSSDPGASALASGEWEDAISRLVSDQRRMLAQMRKPKTA